MAEPKRDYLDPTKEALAVAALRAAITEMDADEELLAGMIEGETSFAEIIDRILGRIRDAEVTIAGCTAVANDLAERERRAKEGQKRDRAMLEQAMTVAGLEKLVRPTATLSLSNRAPSVTVTEESDIPARFWKAGEPVLDKATLTAAVKAREAAMKALPEDPDARAAVLAEHPEIPGAVLTNGAPSLTIRVR